MNAEGLGVMNVEYVLQVYSFGNWKTVKRTVDVSKVVTLLDDVQARFGSEMRVLQSEVNREGSRLWFRLKDSYLGRLRDEVMSRLEAARAEAAEAMPERKSKLR
jgi:hypothetical protein